MKKNIVKKEKGIILKCEKSDCPCKDCNVSKKRWTAGKMFLTISKTDVSRELVLEYYKNNFVYIEWTANKDINSPHYLNLPEEYACYGNIHTKIDTIKKRTKENIYSYMIKTDKQAISWGFNLHKDAIGKLKPKELWYIFYTVE